MDTDENQKNGDDLIGLNWVQATPVCAFLFF